MYELRLVGASEEWLIPFQNIRLTETLNKGITGEVSVNFQTLSRYAAKFSKTTDDVFSDEPMDWKLYRDGSIIYAGILQHRRAAGSKSQATSLNVNLLGYEALLYNRYSRNTTSDWFTNTDSADIAWNLISANNPGLTRGTHPTTINRDKTCRYDQILDAIIDMSNAKTDNGYDWDVSNLKVFNIYYPAKGQTRSNLILDDFNIVDWSSDRDLQGNLANRIIVEGQGQGDAILAEIVNDATSQATWGIQEGKVSAKDTTTTTALDDKGNRQLAQSATPTEVISVTLTDKSPDITEYEVGDTLRVKIADLNFNQLLRIDSRTLQISSGGAQVNLSFEYV